MARPTVHDIAKEAGVSLATVDRVLNGRPRVRESSIRLVLAAVEKLGYVRDVAAANLARRKQYRFAFVIPDSKGLFLNTVREAVNEASLMPRPERMAIEIIATPDDPNITARILLGLPAAQFDGVAIMNPETPQVRDAVMRLKQAGLAVVAMISDLPSSARDRFVGIDNIAAGRTAGSLIGRFTRERPGKILVVAASLVSRDSIERRFGFDSILSQKFPALDVLPTIESRNDPQRLAAIFDRILHDHGSLVGIYSLGGGNAAVLDALRTANAMGRLTIVMHELTEVTRSALLDEEIDVVIMQNVGHIVRSSIRVLRAHVDRTEIFEPQEQIRIEIVMKENLKAL